MNDDFQHLVSILQWAANLPLTPAQRESIRELCRQIAGIPEEARAKRNAIARAEAAEARVKELEKLIEIERQAEEIEDYKHGPPE
jgi:hypothetical protein